MTPEQEPTTPANFYRINEAFFVPADLASQAKHLASIYMPKGYVIGPYHSMKARKVTDAAELAAAKGEWLKRAAKNEEDRLEREKNPVPTLGQLVAILEQAAAIIYEQAHPSTAGREAFERAQNFRNGVLERTIKAYKRDL